MSTQKAVVTGGTGFIGSHLVRALLDKGFVVHVIDSGVGGMQKERMHEGAQYNKVDITDLDAITPIFSGATYVFHEAALPRVQFSIDSPLESFAVNVTGSLNVLHAAHEANVKRVVVASSGSVYGDQTVMPLVETMEPTPKSPYAMHKRMLEIMALVWSEVYHLETVCLRYFNVYGPHMDPNGAYALAVAKFLKQRAAGEPITIWGDGEQTRDFTHVRDVVEANLLAATSNKVGKGEVLNIGSGKNISVNLLAKLIGGDVVHEEARLEPRNSLADNTKAKQLLGWEPKVAFEDGIAELKKMAGVV
jgi:nucleoside-diphosphate-sugar epimerase